ncbi:hypothetical protein PCANC_03189 [Puccinia coronata f. sp. avenae]|uniref:Uncharacterized protein n=1 Tax=Puccinia coronata f. sp. avenae TaxID=200324 RepID=A0A2N5T821_9BASI|nr:hypothetical protein PCANC_03189 [Puccinia coronata f. sp. avenae]
MSSPTKETTPSQTSPSPRTPNDVRVPVPRPGSPASPITKSPPPPIGTDSTPSNASETTAHSEGDAWDLGLSSEALQQATNINHGLQLRFSVWIPTRPNAWTRGAILPALQTEGNEIDLALHDEMARIIHHRMQANQSPHPNAHINAAVTPNLGVPVEQADHSSSPNHRSPSPNQVVPVAQANHSASPDVKILVGVRPPNNMPNGRVFSPDMTVVTTRRFANRRHNQQELPDIIHIPLIDLTLPPYCCSLSPELQPISP